MQQLLNNTSIAVNTITLTSDPKRIQMLGDRIEVSADDWDEWLAYCQEILYRGMLAKFSQNSSLRKDLLSTGECQLLEATTDLQFGCGIGLISDKWADQSWEGQNLTGRTLTEVRDRLRLQDASGGDVTTICDVSTISGSNLSLTDDAEYIISARKSRAHIHSSANCYAMMRSIRPIRAEKTRPRPQDFGNVTDRSQSRGSTMHNMATQNAGEELGEDEESAVSSGGDEMDTGEEVTASVEASTS